MFTQNIKRIHGIFWIPSQEIKSIEAWGPGSPHLCAGYSLGEWVSSKRVYEGRTHPRWEVQRMFNQITGYITTIQLGDEPICPGTQLADGSPLNLDTQKGAMITKDCSYDVRLIKAIHDVPHHSQDSGWQFFTGYESQEDLGRFVLRLPSSALKTPGNKPCWKPSQIRTGKLMFTKRSRVPVEDCQTGLRRKRESMSHTKRIRKEKNENCRLQRDQGSSRHGFTFKNSSVRTSIRYQYPSKIVDMASIDKQSSSRLVLGIGAGSSRKARKRPAHGLFGRLMTAWCLSQRIPLRDF